MRGVLEMKCSEKIFALAFLLVVLLSFSARGEYSGFSAYANSSELKVSSCTQYIDTVYVQNTESQPLTFRVTMSGTASSFSTLAQENFMLLPGESREIYVLISPSCSTSGKYSLKVRFETLYEEKILAQSVSVSPYYNLLLNAKNLSAKFCANESAEFKFTLSNPGAFAESYIISALNLSKKALLSQKEAALAPGELKNITLSYSGLKPGNYNSFLSVDSENTYLVSKIPFSFEIASCLPPKKPVLTALADFIRANIKIIRIILIMLLIVLILLIIFLIIKRNWRRLILWLNQKKEERRERSERRKALLEIEKKPYYKSVSAKSKVLKMAKAKAQPSRYYAPVAAGKKLPVWLRWLIIIVIIVFVLALAAVLLFVVFPKAGHEVTSFFSWAGEKIVSFASACAKKISAFFIGVFSVEPSVKNETKANLSEITAPKKDTDSVPKNATAPKNATSPKNATIPKNSTIPKNATVLKNETAQIAQIANQSIRGINSSASASSESAVEKAKSFIRLYQTYIILGVSIALVFILFLVFSRKRK
jgi:flagellar basal body-associated protein FliL